MRLTMRRLSCIAAVCAGVAAAALAGFPAAGPAAKSPAGLQLSRQPVTTGARIAGPNHAPAVKALATSQEILDALFADAACQAFVTGVTVTATNPSTQVQVFSSYGKTVFSGSGSVLALGSGDPANPYANCCNALGVPAGTDWGTTGCAGDTTQVDIDFNITDPTVRSMSMEFDVYSYEYPTYVGQYNDFAFAYWDQAITPGTDCLVGPLAQYCPAGQGCATSTSPTGGLLTFDSRTPCQPTMVNNAFFTPCSVMGCDSSQGVPGWETAYDNTPGDLAGRTGVLVSAWPVTTGTHRLTLAVGDVSDGLVDTVGVYGRLRCSTQATGCAATSVEATQVPALSRWGLGLLALLLAGLGAWKALARG